MGGPRGPRSTLSTEQQTAYSWLATIPRSKRTARTSSTRAQPRTAHPPARGALRDIRAAIDSGDPAKVKDALRDTISLVDKMAGKSVIHRNAAARYKSRLAKRVVKRTSSAA